MICIVDNFCFFKNSLLIIKILYNLLISDFFGEKKNDVDDIRQVRIIRPWSRFSSTKSG
jgi:hypothetical protein